MILKDCVGVMLITWLPCYLLSPGMALVIQIYQFIWLTSLLFMDIACMSLSSTPQLVRVGCIHFGCRFLSNQLENVAPLTLSLILSLPC